MPHQHLPVTSPLTMTTFLSRMRYSLSVPPSLRLRDTVESAIIHDKVHFTTKHACCVHMLASYLTAVQISRLLKPHAHKFSRPASHGCRARGVACSRTKKPSVSVGTNFNGFIRLVNSSPEGLTEGFDADYLTWSESMIR